jgi:hypothetical protein
MGKLQSSGFIRSTGSHEAGTRAEQSRVISEQDLDQPSSTPSRLIEEIWR